MTQIAPVEVKKAIADDLKNHWQLTRKEVADMLGFASKGSLNNLLSKNEYFPVKTASKLSSHFGYSMLFLTEGKGSMFEAKEVIIYNEGFQDQFEEDLIGKINDWSVLYGSKSIGDFISILSLWLTYYNRRLPGQKKDAVEVALLETLRVIYNEMMDHCRGLRPFIGMHPALERMIESLARDK